MDRLEHRRVAPLRVDIGGRRHAERAGQGGREIGQDVGVQIGRHDGVEAGRLQHHPHGHRVDQHLVPRHVGELGGHLGGDLVPHHHAEALGVGLGDHGEQPARPRLGQTKRIAHDPRDAHAGEDGNLGGHLLGQPPMRPAAMAGIFALAVLPHDHPVQIAGAAIAQRRRDARQNLGGPHVGILVEALADRQAQPPQADMVRHIRRADGAEIDRIEFLQCRQPVGRHHRAVPPVVVGAPVEFLDHEAEIAAAPLQRAQRLQPGGDHLGADAVGGDGGNGVFAHGFDLH